MVSWLRSGDTVLMAESTEQWSGAMEHAGHVDGLRIVDIEGDETAGLPRTSAWSPNSVPLRRRILAMSRRAGWVMRMPLMPGNHAQIPLVRPRRVRRTECDCGHGDPPRQRRPLLHGARHG